jgi:YfiH family protein
MSAPGATTSGDFLFDLTGGGRVLFTTRADGNMSSVGGEGHEQGCEARERLRERLGLRRLARGHQVHGTTVRRIRVEEDIPKRDTLAARPASEADGHATALPGIGVMALAADCLPVALGCARSVAVVHAGWRGLAAGVLEEGVRSLRELEGDGEIVAVIGPGAGPCCYEVGPEVHAAFGDDHGHGRSLDLPALARDRLAAAGAGRIEQVGVCTICDERFFSHRREATRAGRQAGIAWLS